MLGQVARRLRKQLLDVGNFGVRFGGDHACAVHYERAPMVKDKA
jgi:hypothetical protein